MSNWWYLRPLVPIAGIIPGIIMLFLPGTPAPNRCGPDPPARLPLVLKPGR